MDSCRWGIQTTRASSILVIILFFCFSSPETAHRCEHLQYFSDNYYQAGSKFLTAAYGNKGRIKSYQNPQAGPDGRALYLDVALFGKLASQT